MTTTDDRPTNKVNIEQSASGKVVKQSFAIHFLLEDAIASLAPLPVCERAKRKDGDKCENLFSLDPLYGEIISHNLLSFRLVLVLFPLSICDLKVYNQT